MEKIIDKKDSDSFKDLMEEFEDKISEIKMDDKVIGKIIEKKGEFTYLDLGGRLDGRIRTDLLEVSKEYSAGDEVEIFVTGVREGFYSCSIEPVASFDTESGGTRGEIGFSEGSVVTGKISSHNKGGFEVIVSGISCFVPFSKMGMGSGDDPDIHVGKSLKFYVEEIDTEKDRYILSRREIVKAERDKKKNEFLNSLEEGNIYSGTVKSIMDYGAFIEVGEIQGLLHISDISHEKIKSVNDVLSVGDELEVLVKNIERETGKIAFSKKELAPDPWDDFIHKFSVGDKFEGTVETLKPYGAFVNILPGISGLVHISKLGTGKFHKHPKEVFRVGDKANFWVESINNESRKISLSGNSPETDYSGLIKKIHEESESKGKDSSSSAFGEMLDNVLKGKK